MRVYLCRHGEAVAQAPTDAERPLTERGRLEVMALWQDLRAEGVRMERLIASPYRRAQQTALCIARAFGGQEQEACGWLVPEARPQAFLDWLIQQPEQDNTVLVSHMPLVSLLTAAWIGEPTARPAFRVGTVAALDVEVAAPGGARLLWMRGPG
ncbi:phosphohistidine phosphatase SixA [Alloalcanivorax sp. C16-1]|uniref:phosphohistidine phosphatase SixA n=1 Tax=Alloalcanivorax sp. C16-1 TaxID=3390051 RepID=UPI003970E52B|nr:phosphohistidine phosphatase SixA [Alcanivorax sp.]